MRGFYPEGQQLLPDLRCSALETNTRPKEAAYRLADIPGRCGASGCSQLGVWFHQAVVVRRPRARCETPMPAVGSTSMIKRKIVHFNQQWLAKLPPPPEEGELVTCPACLGQHPLIYEDEEPTAPSWGYVECD